MVVGGLSPFADLNAPGKCSKAPRRRQMSLCGTGMPRMMARTVQRCGAGGEAGRGNKMVDNQRYVSSKPYITERSPQIGEPDHGQGHLVVQRHVRTRTPPLPPQEGL